MGLLRNVALRGTDIQAELGPRAAGPNMYWSSQTPLTAPLSYNEAIQCPAVCRSISLIKGICASLPLEMYDEATDAEVEGPEWLKQPDPRMARGVQIAATIEDLAMHGWAYWEVLELFPGTMKPSRFAYVAWSRVLPQYNRTMTLVDGYNVDGERRPMDGIGSLITFQGLDQGALVRGRTAIRRAYELQQAALLYSAQPVPQGIIKNNGADLPANEVTGVLNQWKSARKRGAVGYLSAQFEWQASSYSPIEMALNEQIDNSDSQIAELFNLDPYWVNAQKSSMTYSNVRDVNRQLYQTTLRYYLDPIEQRLNFADLAIPGYEYKFSLDEFLRSDATERINVIEKMLTTGMISIEEARGMEDLAPRGSADVESVQE